MWYIIFKTNHKRNQKMESYKTTENIYHFWDTFDGPGKYT